jgi:hypothetical protein
MEEMTKTAVQAIEILKSHARGRPIVPFLGAGVSVATGFPSIKQINQYLAKVDFAIQEGVYRHRYPRLPDCEKRYRDHPSRFLLDFGWPDPGQLEADLWRWLGDHHDADPTYGYRRTHVLKERTRRAFEPEHSPVEDDIAFDLCESLNWHADPNSEWQKKCCINGNNPFRLDRRSHLDAIVQYHLRRDLSRMESGGDDAAFLHWWRWKGWYFGGPDAPSTKGASGEPERLHGNWESLLDHLCEGSLDLTDQLFTQLELGRRPSLAHRYLVFLQEKLAMPMVLTTNFDSLLERGFLDHGVDFKVFDVHRDAALPDPALIRRQFSIVKLHGSAYGLRLGERLKYPLDPTAREQVLACIPANALVVVLGFSGSERRIVQLLHALGTRQQEGHEARLNVLWLWKGPLSDWAKELIQEQPDRIHLALIDDANTFLQELYYRYADGHPAGKVAYPAMQNGCGFPGPSSLDEKWRHENPPPWLPNQWIVNFHRRSQTRQPIHLFLPYNNKINNVCSTAWSTLAAASFVHQLDYTYRLIWIDLENHHTVAGIAAEFFSKARAFDPHAPQAPLTDSDDAILKIVERIGEVFQRGKYVLVLDSLECFGRSQMMHHGVPSFEAFDDDFLNKLEPAHDGRKSFLGLRDQIETQFESRVSGLKQFLRLLMHIEPNKSRPAVEQFFSDSYLCITVGGQPRVRVSPDAIAPPTDLRTIQCLKELVKVASVTRRNCRCVVQHRQSGPGYAGIAPERFAYPLCDYVTTTFPPSYWRRASNDEDSDKQTDLKLESRHRTSQQLRDVFNLLKYLCESSDSESSDSIATEARNGFLALMSVVRRPRTIPLIRSLTERWVLRIIGNKTIEASLGLPEEPKRRVRNKDVHDRVDKLIDRLTGKDSHHGAGASASKSVPVVGRWEDGGSLWLFREIHESVYEALTENLPARKWIQSWQKGSKHPDDIDPSATILNGLLTITWHWAAARSFYADIFRPTGDVHAFYEYLYHRMSALRAMTLLLAVLDEDIVFTTVTEFDEMLPVKPAPTALNESAFARFLEVLGVFEPLGLKSMQTIDNKASLRLQIHRLRTHGLQTLEKALIRNRDRFRRNATPQTLEAWSWQFLNREIYDLNGEVFLLSSTEQLRAKKRLNAICGPGFDKEDPMLDAALAGEVTAKALSKYFAALQQDSVAAQLDFRRAASLAVGSIQNKMNPKIQASNVVRDQLKLKLQSEVDWGEKYGSNVRQSSELLGMLRSAMDLNVEAKLVSQILEQAIKNAVWNAKDNDLQTFHELRTKHQFREWLIWEPLINRTPNPDGQDLEKRLEKDSVQNLWQCEDFSREYENVLRATAESIGKDARHRSSALALRARSLYLRGKFRQAHRWLDLAAAGLNSTVPEQQVSLAVVHLNRAELLALSADEHYFQNLRDSPQARLREISAELQKLDRADRELRAATDYLRDASHLARQRIRLEIGNAVIRQEILLFQLEQDFWEYHSESRPLLDKEFAHRSGAIERSTLEAMRALRSVLDNLPLEKGKWKDVETEGRQNEPLIRTELQVYALWRQLFVVAMAYSALLRRMTDGHTTPEHVIEAMGSRSPGIADDRNRWRNWARSMRFEQLARLTDDEATTYPPPINSSLQALSLRGHILAKMMHSSRPDNCHLAWNERRR